MNNASVIGNYTNLTHSHVYVRYVHTGGLCHLDSSVLIYFYAGVLALLAIIATVENVLVLILMCKHAVLRTPSLLMLGILAGVDLVTGAIVIPIKAAITLSHHHGLLVVLLWLFFTVVCLSLATVVMISIDRFCHVYFLEHYNLSKKKLCLAVILSWLLPVVLLILLALRQYWVGYIILGFFFASIVTMVIAYIAMIIALRRHSARVNDTTRENYIKNEKQAVKTTLIIVVTFIIMNVPTVLSIALGFTGIYSQSLCAITLFAMLANSAVNPLIYCWRIPVIKKHVLKFLCIRSFTGNINSEESHDMILTVHDEDTNI